MRIKTGDIFVAENKFGKETLYKFLYIDLDDPSGYPIILEDIDASTKAHTDLTCVETAWFSERAVRPATEPERLHAVYGWPMKIHARGYDAHLVGAQPLFDSPPAPIYRFPGGDSLVSETEMRG